MLDVIKKRTAPMLVCIIKIIYVNALIVKIFLWDIRLFCKGVEEQMKFVKRIVIYLAGIVLLALGGVLTIKSNLGASPVSLLPLSISKVSSIELGMAAFLLFTFYVILQIIILKKEFKMIQLLQILFAVLFGNLMNFFNDFIQINADNIYVMSLLCILGFLLTAIGIVFTITAKIVPVAPDGLVQAIGIKAKIDFGKAKIYLDCVIVLLAIVLLLLNNKGLDEVGIGTILSAILVGRIVFWINKNYKQSLEEFMFTTDSLLQAK